MDIDPSKALAALEQLEAERAKRLQAKIDAGEVMVISAPVIVCDEDEVPEAIERAKERARAHFDFTVVRTGVPRPDHYDEPKPIIEAEPPPPGWGCLLDRFSWESSRGLVPSGYRYSAGSLIRPSEKSTAVMIVPGAITKLFALASAISTLPGATRTLTAA
jgi:hypothetical protein